MEGDSIAVLGCGSLSAIPRRIEPSEPAEIEIEWQLLQAGKDSGDDVDSALDDLGVDSESITRRYEFYAYIGPYKNDGEALFEDPEDPTIDPVEFPNGIVGDFLGAQNAAFNLAPFVPESSALALLGHRPDGTGAALPATAERRACVARGVGDFPDARTRHPRAEDGSIDAISRRVVAAAPTVHPCSAGHGCLATEKNAGRPPLQQGETGLHSSAEQVRGRARRALGGGAR
jgi:hypothetical protein